MRPRTALARNKTRGKQKGCMIPRWVGASATTRDTVDTSSLQPQTYAPLAPWRALLVPGRRGVGGEWQGPRPGAWEGNLVLQLASRGRGGTLLALRPARLPLVI